MYSKPIVGFHFLVSIDSYGKGYSDAVILKQDNYERLQVNREKISKTRDDMSDEDKQRSEARARKKLRQKVIMLKPDDMLTLTFGTQVYTREEAYSCLKSFNRLMVARWPNFKYAGVPEKHKKGGYHFHLAIVGSYHWNTVRALWRRATGTGTGNVHFSNKGFSRTHGCPVRKAIRIAGYMTKYFTKDDCSGLFEKRYSSSQGIMLPRKEKYYIPLLNYTFEQACEIAEAIIAEVTGRKVQHVFDPPNTGRQFRWFKNY